MEKGHWLTDICLQTHSRLWPIHVQIVFSLYPYHFFGARCFFFKSLLLGYLLSLITPPISALCTSRTGVSKVVYIKPLGSIGNIQGLINAWKLHMYLINIIIYLSSFRCFGVDEGSKIPLKGQTSKRFGNTWARQAPWTCTNNHV